jgi:hypothetical protein
VIYGLSHEPEAECSPKSSRDIEPASSGTGRNNEKSEPGVRCAFGGAIDFGLPRGLSRCGSARRSTQGRALRQVLRDSGLRELIEIVDANFASIGNERKLVHGATEFGFMASNRRGLRRAYEHPG